MFSLSIGWLAAAIILFVIEGLTFNLVTVWFAAGCAAALVVSLFISQFSLQFLVFVAVSLLCLLASRPLAERLRRPSTATNGDRNLGRTAVVLTPVSSAVAGRVRLDGVDWNARAGADVSLQPGEACRVVAIQSTLLIVEPQPAAAAPR